MSPNQLEFSYLCKRIRERGFTIVEACLLPDGYVTLRLSLGTCNFSFGHKLDTQYIMTELFKVEVNLVQASLNHSLD